MGPKENKNFLRRKSNLLYTGMSNMKERIISTGHRRRINVTMSFSMCEGVRYKSREGDWSLLEHDIYYYCLCMKNKLVNNKLFICYYHSNSINRN